MPTRPTSAKSQSRDVKALSALAGTGRPTRKVSLTKATQRKLLAASGRAETTAVSKRDAVKVAKLAKRTFFNASPTLVGAIIFALGLHAARNGAQMAGDGPVAFSTPLRSLGLLGTFRVPTPATVSAAYKRLVHGPGETKAARDLQYSAQIAKDNLAGWTAGEIQKQWLLETVVGITVHKDFAGKHKLGKAPKSKWRRSVVAQMEMNEHASRHWNKAPFDDAAVKKAVRAHSRHPANRKTRSKPKTVEEIFGLPPKGKRPKTIEEIFGLPPKGKRPKTVEEIFGLPRKK